MQSLPLGAKVNMTKRRIQEWYEAWDGNVYLSLSGGKDSTVLLDIARSIYPDMRAVFFDTGLEYPSVRDFVKTFPNVEMVRPAMPFMAVVKKYGYPVFTKEISQKLDEARRYIEIHRDELKASIGKEDPSVYELSWEAAKWNTGHARLWCVYQPGVCWKTGIPNPRVHVDTTFYDFRRYQFMLEAPFKVSNKCCKILKKDPAARYAKEHGEAKGITGTMADESFLRRSTWITHGCNNYDSRHPVSSPMSFWTQEDVLQYISEKKLPIASVYGDIVLDEKKCCLKTTGCDRTGCFACGFGAHRKGDKRLFNLFEQAGPKVGDWLLRGGTFDEEGMWIPKGGMGMAFIYEWMNVHGGYNIQFPDKEKYLDALPERAKEMLK